MFTITLTPARQVRACTLKGHPEVPFSWIVQDTIREHGLSWAVRYFCKKHGLSALEFRIFAGI